MTAKIYEIHTYRARGFLARWVVLPSGGVGAQSLRRIHKRVEGAQMVRFVPYALARQNVRAESLFINPTWR